MPKRTFIHNICTIMLISAVIGVSIGIIDTFLLIYSNLFLDEQCFPWIILKDTCQAVTKSDYGNIWGMPLALLGFIGFVALLKLLLSSISDTKLIIPVVLGSFLALIFSIYFIYLQAFVIKKWCPLCVISFISTIIIFFSSTVRLFLKKDKIDFSNISKYFPQIIKKSVYSLFITSAISISIFETIHNRKLLTLPQDTQPTFYPKCRLSSPSYPFAAINEQLITLKTIDDMLFEKDSSTCLIIKNLRIVALDMILIEKEMLKYSQKNPQKKINYYHLFFNFHSIPLPKGHIINSISSFSKVFKKLDKKNLQKINEKLSNLRVKHKVVINNFK